jgi:hypothetical protein
MLCYGEAPLGRRRAEEQLGHRAADGLAGQAHLDDGRHRLHPRHLDGSTVEQQQHDARVRRAHGGDQTVHLWGG